jgi:hypothetical protein
MEGNSRPSDWDWCPYNTCLLTHCTISCIYDSEDRVDPQKEYYIEEEEFSIDVTAPCPHYVPVSQVPKQKKNKKSKKKALSEEIAVTEPKPVPTLVSICEKYIIESGLVKTMNNLDMLPEIISSRLFSILVDTYTVI